MKTLFITHHYLSSNGGGSFASRAFINAFADVSDEITLVYPVKDGQNVFLEINPKIKCIPVKYNIPGWRKVLHLLIGKVHRFFDIIDEILDESKYDIAVFDTSIVSYRLIDKVKATGAKTIVIHHNYQYEFFRDNTKFPLSLPILFWCKKYERLAVKKADLNLTLTRQDILLLSHNYNKGISENFRYLGVFEFCNCIPNSCEGSPKQIERFVITGNLSDMQTECSIIPWLKGYYHTLKEEFPLSTLVVAGKNPSKSLADLCEKLGVVLIPSPESMDDILKNADYYICPTSLGGGLKLRIMDGLRWGLPVLTHVVSARGYDSFVDKGYMYTYSDNSSFRRSLLSLKKKTIIKSEILDEYRRNFSFEVGVRRVKAIVEGLCVRKNMLIFHPYLAPYRLDLYNRFTDDYNVNVLLTGSKKELDTLGFDLDYVNSQSKFDYSYYSAAAYLGRHPVTTIFWKSIRKFEPDVVLSHEYGINTIAAILAKPFFKYRHYLTCDDSFPMATGYGIKRRLLRNFVIRHVDGIICVHPDVVDFLNKEYQKTKCKFLYFPIIQDDKLLEAKINATSEIAQQYVSKYDLKGKHIILFVGRLVPEKRIDLAIDSFRNIATDNFRFVIVGGGISEGVLKEKVAKCGLAGNVIFTGPLSGADLFAWYYLSHLFILASSHEPFGAVVNEALSGGCRCIVSNHCGSIALIVPENGRIFESGNLIQLSSIIKLELSNITKPKVHHSLMSKSFGEFYSDLVNEL